jgi:hypothetical protein
MRHTCWLKAKVHGETALRTVMTVTVVLVTTNRKAARYLPVVRSAIDTFWTDRPPVRFLTDGGVEPATDVYIEPEPCFVPLLARGLARVSVEFPNATHIFHMLEDHCPLRACDADRISAIVSMAINQDLAAVAFPTYTWPWNDTDTTEYPDGLVRTWRRIDTLEIAGETLGLVPMDFFRYFQVQPTIWRRKYLDHACAAAVATGVFDPWQFEALRLSTSEQHYVSGYSWPTVHHGFLVQGDINPAAIDFVDRKAGDAIRHQLIRHLVGTSGETIFKFKRAVSHYIQRFTKRIKVR